ncbi:MULTISPECIES: hypothetical protein [unclassified Nocardia]|uniref:hypothetical protein n=1 Tax=unclassified Nocardia TaxID=2637762 RepID=UPI00278C1DC0|nr:MULTISPECIES: hypothetical protein [unclassified Nocardia]
MSDIPAADERAILDQLRRLQDAHHSGDQQTATALLDELFDRYGRDTVAAVRRRQAADQLDADLNLCVLFGPAALYGND